MRTEVRFYTDDGNLRRLDEIEADIIRLALVMYDWRITKVARVLKISRSALYRRLEQLGLTD